MSKKIAKYFIDGTTPLGGPAYFKLMRVEDGIAFGLNADCGREDRPSDWRKKPVGEIRNYYRKVGMWSFVQYDDEAADDIAFCERSPHSAGRMIHGLQQQNAELLEQVNRVDWCKWHSDEDGNWWTECEESFVFNDGGPKENRMDFCPYCGSLIEIAERLEGGEW